MDGLCQLVKVNHVNPVAIGSATLVFEAIVSATPVFEWLLLEARNWETGPLHGCGGPRVTKCDVIFHYYWSIIIFMGLSSIAFVLGRGERKTKLKRNHGHG